MTKRQADNSPDPQMIEMIKREWGDVLGDYAPLLDHPGGLDEIISLIRSGSLARKAYK